LERTLPNSREVVKLRTLLIAISIVIVFGCSSLRTDEELTETIIQLIQNEPDRWLTVETLRNVTYNYKSRDGGEEITLNIRKMFPSTAVMFSPYTLEFSLDSSARIESEFKTWRIFKSLS
jgi:hypothetical protein